jgi:hypothetical protein
LGDAALGALATGMGDGAARDDQGIVLPETPLVLADRYTGVNPLGVLYLSHRVGALILL